MSTQDTTITAGAARAGALGGTEAPEVAVHLFAAAAAALGSDTARVRGRTVAEVLDALGARTDDEGRRVLARSSVLVNAVACRDRDRQLAAADRVDVLPPFAGG